jgi:malate dehydrogenase (oxaloacetate-decarboxylating)(NADP+)
MPLKKSIDIIRDKAIYKSIAFTRAERKRLGLEGLLPHAVTTQAQLVSRLMESLARVPRDID